MRKALPLMITLLLAAPLAGCAGSDGEVNVNLTTEEIQGLIEHNMDDFLNNTTVTVVNHYHNNTTVLESSYEYSNQSSSSNHYHYNGSETNEQLIVLPIQFDTMEIIGGDPTEIPLTRPLWKSDELEWDYGGDEFTGPIDNFTNTTIFIIHYNGQNVEIGGTCADMYKFGQWDTSEWRDYLLVNYGQGEDLEATASALRNNLAGLYSNFGNFLFLSHCIDGFVGWHTFFEIDLELGQALEIVSQPYGLTIDFSCDDGSSSGGIGNGTHVGLIGGQANCTITGSTNPRIDFDGVSVYSNGSHEYVLMMDEAEGIPPESFNFYYVIHHVMINS